MKYILSVFLFFPASALAFFGTLGRDQCPYPTTPMPTYQGDSNHSYLMQAQQLEEVRRRLQSELGHLNGEQARLQAGVRGYFQAPWYDTMLAHMDNGYDCCEGGVVASNSQGGNRMTASAEPVDPLEASGPAQTVADTAAPTGAVAVSPDESSEVTGNAPPPVAEELGQVAAPAPAPVPTPAPVPVPNPVAVDTSCNGYSQQYCANNWGAPATPAHPGAQCLQTGFASTPAWYRAACRGGGRIDPQSCSHPQISRNPNEYQACINVLAQYYRLAGEKRRLAAQLQEVNDRIHALRNPNRAYRFANDGGQQNPGLNIGSLLSGILPLLMNQYSSYRQPVYRHSPGVYRPMPRPIGGPGPRPYVSFQSTAPYAFPQAQPRFIGLQQPPPPFYGPRYGYGFSYAGNYGGVPPGYRTGGFGCSTGVGSGHNLLSMLMGGNRMNQYGPRFGPHGGYAPYQAYNLAYGNRYSGIPPHTFPGYAQPYRPGGIYGGPQPRPILNSPNVNVPQYYTNNQPRYIGGAPYSYGPQPLPQPVSITQPQLVPQYSTQPRPIYQPNSPQYNSYFYAQNQNLQQNYSQYQRAYELDYNVHNGPSYYSSGYSVPVYQRPYQPGLIPTLLSLFNNN